MQSDWKGNVISMKNERVYYLRSIELKLFYVLAITDTGVLHLISTFYENSK
jgi:hypothetical protein